MIVKVKDIKIPPRFRAEYGDLSQVAKSFRVYGQLQSMLVVRAGTGYELVAGARRLLSCIQNGTEEVEAIVKESLDELKKREMEVEENIQRKDFTWQEEVRAKAELLALRRARQSSGIFGGEPRIGKDVAAELGESASGFSMDVELAEGMEKFPELALEDKKSNAYKKLKQKKENLVRKFLADNLESEREGCTVYNEDCLEVLARTPSESIDLIVTDPPWGVEYQNAEGVKGQGEMYVDEAMEVFPLLEKVLPELYRVLVPDSHLYLFFGTKHYTVVHDLLRTADFAVEPIPLIWYKKTGQNIWPHLKFTPTYETIFFCKKGNRLLNKPCNAVFEYSSPTNKVHPNQKPVGLLKELIELSSLENEVVLDPFAGSGSTLKAGLELGRKVVGVEKNETFFNDLKLFLEEKQEKGGEEK